MTVYAHQVERILRKLQLVDTDGMVRSALYAYTVERAAERIAEELNTPPARRGDIVTRDELDYVPFGMVVRDRTSSQLHVRSNSSWLPVLSRGTGRDFFVEYNPDHPEVRHE